MTSANYKYQTTYYGNIIIYLVVSYYNAYIKHMPTASVV